MNKDVKFYRDKARLAVFAQFPTAMVTVLVSTLVSTVILAYYMYFAEIKNIMIFSQDMDVMRMTSAVLVMAQIANAPVEFCAMRSFYLISRLSRNGPARVRDIFTPFRSLSFLMKGAAVMLLSAVINTLGIFLLFFPVYFSICMTPFILSDNPETSVFKAFSESFRMTRGNKMKVFRIVAPSMLFYCLSSVFCAGMGIIGLLITAVLQSHFYVTLAVAYRGLKEGKGDNVGDVSE